MGCTPRRPSGLWQAAEMFADALGEKHQYTKGRWLG